MMLTKTELLNLMNSNYKKFNRGCLDNPEVVSSLIFDTTLPERIRDDLLFYHSMDDNRMCTVSDNPKWSQMMRKFIIPRISELSVTNQMLIRWHQDIHGL